MTRGCPEFRRTNRRGFLRIGGTAALGLTMSDLFRARAEASAGLLPQRKADQMLLVWLPGGPPHIDMFDMKPEAPEEIRGEFKPIKTNVTGLEICELMPRLAKIADKYTVIRSCTTGRPVAQHSPNQQHWLASGNPRKNGVTPKYPTYGSVLAKLRPAAADVPSFVALSKPSYQTGESYLGSGFAPLVLSGDSEVAQMLKSPQLDLFRRDLDLAQSLNQRLRELDQLDPIIAGRDQFQQKAFDLLRSPKLRAALDYQREDSKARERYVASHPDAPRSNSTANSCMEFVKARRLIEAGVPLVQLNFGGWDFHSKNAEGCRKQVPYLDAAVASLLEDLDDRGLLERTIVVVAGEMGRTPWAQGAAGRDHWPTQFIFVAGGGFARGRIVGATDKHAAQVTENYYTIESFARTVYHLLGIDASHELETADGRPLKIVLKEAPLINEALA